MNVTRPLANAFFVAPMFAYLLHVNAMKVMLALTFLYFIYVSKYQIIFD